MIHISAIFSFLSVFVFILQINYFKKKLTNSLCYVLINLYPNGLIIYRIRKLYSFISYLCITYDFHSKKPHITSNKETSFPKGVRSLTSDLTPIAASWGSVLFSTWQSAITNKPILKRHGPYSVSNHRAPKAYSQARRKWHRATQSSLKADRVHGAANRVAFLSPSNNVITFQTEHHLSVRDSTELVASSYRRSSTGYWPPTIDHGCRSRSLHASWLSWFLSGLVSLEPRWFIRNRARQERLVPFFRSFVAPVKLHGI